MKSKIESAHQIIKNHIRHTPLEYDPFLSSHTGADVFLKLENYQLSGSFKIRGAMHKLLLGQKSLDKSKEYVAVSSGNHAIAFAHGMKQFNLKGKVFMPKDVAIAKLDIIKQLGLPYELYGDDCLETEIYTRDYAEKNNAILVHPYNDISILEGQGTIGVELIKDLPNLDTVIVPVGGGGLIGGIGSYLKSVNQNIEVVGTEPENSPEMSVSISKGFIIEELIAKPTLSDGTAGGIEQGAITFEYCKKYVDRIELISEEEITQAIRYMLEKHQMIIEGSAGLSIATLLKHAPDFKGKKVVLILCGKRLSNQKLQKIIESDVEVFW